VLCQALAATGHRDAIACLVDLANGLDATASQSAAEALEGVRGRSARD
jgi:hypothetical protein